MATESTEQAFGALLGAKMPDHGESQESLGISLDAGRLWTPDASLDLGLMTSTMSADLHLAQSVPLLLPGTAK